MKSLIVLTVACFVGFTACTTTDAPESSAEILTMDKLTKTPGYSWFVAEMSTYSPDSTVISEISTSMSASTDRKVCIFVKPSCSCRGTQRLFPQVVKTLVAANVDMSRVEIWSMRSESDKQPYQPTITLTHLPAIYILDKGAVRSVVSDLDYTDTNADSLIAKAVK
ncbi:MAG: hypothetical protein NTX15_06500 [Candidatus Kapabacteria bacterium]|nr:hypothetical protein [Candidatus Kapabacteria bacterium]